MDTLTIRRRLLASLAFLLAPVVGLAQPDSRTHDTGAVQFDVFDRGKLGAYADGNAAVGTGFVFNGENGLFEASVLVGAGFDQVSGDAYEYPDVEWATVTPFSSITPPAGFDEAYGVAFNDAVSNDPIGVRVTERSYSNTGDPFVVVDLDVTNTTGSGLSGIYVGIFADWDVSTAFTSNLGGYNVGTQLLYVWDDSGTSTNYFGVAALEGTSGVNVSGVSYDVLPGDAILFGGLTVIQTPPSSPADRRTVIGTGPYTIGAGETVNVKFAFVGGTSLADIVDNAAEAQASVVGSCEQELTATLNDDTPAPGDIITFTTTVTNNGAAPAPLDLWLDYTGPDSRRIFLGRDTVPAGATVVEDVLVRVPPGYSPGLYDVDLNVGSFASDEICDTANFMVTVTNSVVGGGARREEVEGLAFERVTAAGAAAPVAAVSPNPFARQTTIHYDVAAPSDVRLAVYDLLGREVAVLVDGRVEAGAHTATFDAGRLAAGTYVYRLTVGGTVQTGRMSLVR